MARLGLLDPAFDENAFRERIGRALSRYGCGPSKIATRGLELSDCTHMAWAEMALYKLGELPRGEMMLARMRLFEKLAMLAMERLYAHHERPPQDLLHVTCTGYLAPSVAQALVAKRGWGKTTRVTHAYHMGCYASIPALHIAAGFAAADATQRAEVDVVHTELCSLHLNPSLHTPEQLVIQTLFADGIINYSVNAGAAQGREPGLELLAIAQETIPDSGDAMQWICSDWGMQMALSRDVPHRLAKDLLEFTTRLCELAGMNRTEIGRAHFAIHPGGPKILDLTQELLQLNIDQAKHSRDVLLQRGNMSSATLPYIWMRLLDDDAVLDGQTIISLAFGPGLTLCGAVLRKVAAC